MCVCVLGVVSEEDVDQGLATVSGLVMVSVVFFTRRWNGAYTVRCGSLL